MKTEVRRQKTDNRSQAAESGFTLIEAIMTLVVLSIAAVGVLSVFTVGMQGSSNPLLINQAIVLAQDRMETIVGDRENALRGFAYIQPANYAAESPVTGFPNFNRSVSIICVNSATLNTDNGQAPPCTTSNYAHVTVRVTHATFGSIALDTIVTNY